MAKRMAVTHADLAPSRPGTGFGSKTGAFLTVLTILCGLLCFILCLIAEVTRSKVLGNMFLSQQFLYETLILPKQKEINLSFVV